MKKAVLGLLFLGFAQASVAMQPAAARTAGQLLKHYGKKTFPKTMTGLHWGIAAGLPISAGLISTINTLGNDIFTSTLRDSNHQTTYFIATELLKNGVKINGVKTLPMADNQPPIIAPTQPNFTIWPSVEKEITVAMEKNDESTQQKYKSILKHNAIQIKHNDFQQKNAAFFAMPFITHAVTKSLYNNLAYAKKAKPFLLQQYAKIPTGFGKLALSMVALQEITNYQLQRTDNEMPNDRDTLMGLKSYLTDLNMPSKLPYPLDRTEKRIQKLDRRIAELEKTQEN